MENKGFNGIFELLLIVFPLVLWLVFVLIDGFGNFRDRFYMSNRRFR